MHDIYENSRQDRTREILTDFENGTGATVDALSLSLYPKELDKFKKEFPSLSFEKLRTYDTGSGKKIDVKVSKNNQ